MNRGWRTIPCCAALVSLLLGPGPASGAFLGFVETQKDGVDGVDGLDAAISAVVSPDGKHVYTASQDDDAVAVFRRDDVTASLGFVEVQQDGVNGVDGLGRAASVTVSPDGRHVYTASQDDDAVAVFRRNAATGRLTFVEALKDGVNGVDGLNRATSVTVSPEGTHIYAAGSFDNAVAVFRRNAATGRLTFEQVLKDGVNGVDGLNRATSVTVSPDGTHIYATADTPDNAVAVFRRNAATGRLTFVEALKDGVNGVDGLNRAWSVTVSPDGNHVYAAGYWEHKVAVFRRNEVSGRLTFVEVQEGGPLGTVDGLRRPTSIRLSPDGSHVFVAGSGEDALVAFSRSAVTGRLAFVETRKDGAGGVDGLGRAASVTTSPDGKHVYVAGNDDDALAVFTLPVWTLTSASDGSGAGTIASDPSGVSCPGTCANTFLKDSGVTLTGTPDIGSALDGWSAPECPGNGNCHLTLDRDRTVTATFNPDTDGDGISDRIEDAGPYGGDANRNGLPDSAEANVATFESVACGPVTLISALGTTLEGVTFEGFPSEDDTPSDYTIPDCFCGFTIQGLPSGAATVATLILHQEHREVNAYVKYGPTPDQPAAHWYVFHFDGGVGAKVLQEPSEWTRIDLYLKDGSLGDDDLLENGAITDIGAPAASAGDSTGGGGDSGCILSDLLETE